MEEKTSDALELWTDGSTTGYGLVLKSTVGKTMCVKASVLPPSAIDHSDAEYLAVIGGLLEAKELGATRVHVRSDSDFMINQLKGKFRIGSRMRHYYDRVQEAIEGMEVSFEWIPRGENEAADKLSKDLR